MWYESESILSCWSQMQALENLLSKQEKEAMQDSCLKLIVI